MIGKDYYVAAPDDPTEAFHGRLRKIAQECGAFFIKLGHPENIKPLKEAPPYPPRGALPTPDGRRQRYDA